MCHRLHLTQVPRASVDDPCMRAALLGVHHNFGTSGEGTELRSGDDSQPGVSGALGRRQDDKRVLSTVSGQGLMAEAAATLTCVTL